MPTGQDETTTTATASQHKSTNKPPRSTTWGALERVTRIELALSAWEATALGESGSRRPARIRRAGTVARARTSREYDEIAEMFTDLYPDVAVPKNAGRWISAVQHRMAQAGEHRSASAVDLVVAATAAHHSLAVLHDDADYRAIARHASDLLEHNVHDVT
ncbi:VapC toxin family PIN domain ribonuclease [Streptomyces sp. NPDC101234]|uniref:VapC toxin family PIN domain ribonuclease n=1 Tax=Streptomyces sp. NPDC101234 TaxID=3366138 RepID=UPI00380FAF69